MEAIVSLLILGILMTTIVAIIRFSMVMTGNFLREATQEQEDFNALLLGDYTGSPSEISFNSADPDVNVSVTFDIEYYSDDEIENVIAFKPK